MQLAIYRYIQTILKNTTCLIIRRDSGGILCYIITPTIWKCLSMFMDVMKCAVELLDFHIGLMYFTVSNIAIIN